MLIMLTTFLLGLQLVYFFQQEIFNVDVLHAPFVCPRQDIVAHHDDFGIGHPTDTICRTV